MQEHQVTIEGNVHSLAEPFMVVASQIPAGGPGTYPLAEVQLDRFMFRVWSGYPSAEEESEVLDRIDQLEEPALQPATTPEEILWVRDRVRKVYVSDDVRRYVISLVNRLREDPDVAGGPSPRAGIALYKGGRALAFLEGRDYVLPDDVKELALPALVHRVHVRPEAEIDGVTPEAVVQRALAEVAVPKPTA
jgi:MoxR-like ATPase